MSAPNPRLVPTLTEVLDEQLWSAGDAEGETPVSPLAPFELPDLLEPIIDLSDEAVAQGSAPPEPLEGVDRLTQSSCELVEQAFDTGLRNALAATLTQIGPGLVELLLPQLRQRLLPEMEALVATAVEQALRRRTSAS